MMADWHNSIPLATWAVTQAIKTFLPSLAQKFPKRLTPFVAIGLGIVVGAVVDKSVVDVAFPSITQALTNAGYGGMAIALHELGESVTNKRSG